MVRKRFMKFFTTFLSICMVLAMIPTSVYATEFVSETHDVFKNTESTLAPGVKQNIKYAYAKDGKQMVYYVTTADISRDDVVVQTSYYKQHEDGVLGMEKLTNQMAYAKDKYSNEEDEHFISKNYTPVAGINASFYNMTTGQPMGVTYIDGVSFGTNSYDNFFAILKDGTAVIDYRSNEGNYTGDKAIEHAVAGSVWLVRDGKDVTANASGSYNTDRHSRTCVGVTAEGKVVTMVLDGRQEPFSCGGSMHELAQIMLEQGCVAAINLDGGGSATYAARPEGEDDVKVINRPSDGSERSISAGLIIASTAASSNTFEKVKMEVEDNYVAPGVSTELTVAGVSPAGTSAEIPEGVTYTAENGTVKDGVYTAGVVEGEDTIQAIYNGDVVGSTKVNVVTPSAIKFNQAEMLVPFGKTVKIGVTATTNNGMNTVKIDENTVDFTLDAQIGSINGFEFTANEDAETATEATCTVTVKDTDVKATAKIYLGKGSETIDDFEDGKTNNWVAADVKNYNYIFPKNNISVANKENGQVHSGEYSLRAEVDYSNSWESGYMATALSTNETITIENGLSLGMWIYVPEEIESLRLRMCFYDENDQRKTAELLPIGKVSTLDTPGWYYVSADISSYPVAKILQDKAWIEFYICDRDDIANYGYNHLDYDSVNTNVAFYIDDITVDYSSAVEDREAPIFGDATYAYKGASDAATLNDGTTISNNEVDFAANVAENTEKTNAVGIDASTAKAYIDGNEVPATYKNGKIAINKAYTLSDGKHFVKFEIADKNGNVATTTRSFNIVANSGKSTVKVVAHDKDLKNILLGSVYYVDLVATDIENVKSVSVDLDLNNISVWQLDNMNVTNGFSATYSISEDDNVATINITREGNVDATGENVLVSMPIRTWELPIGPSEDVGASKPTGTVLTYNFYKKPGQNSGEVWPMSINVKVDKGIVTFVDDTTDFFSGDNVKVMTESRWWHNDSAKDDVDAYTAWNGGHDHRAETKQYYADGTTNHVDAVALEDKEPTCTEDGYKDRTFCEVCNSVVDWGTTIKATGHSYEVIDGKLKCSSCGELYNGEWEDGKTYVDGAVIEDGWQGESYYKDGKKLTGLQKIDGYYYDFGEDGICPNKAKLDGFYYDKEADAYKHFTAGEMSIGDVAIYPTVYFFDENGCAISGDVDVLGYNCNFSEKGEFVSSDNKDVVDAGYCGTNIKYVLLSNGTLKVGGEGKLKDYTANGFYPAWIIKNDLNKITSIEIGNKITEIGRFAFFRNGYVRSVKFEDNSSLKKIGWGAFGHCWRLADVTIPASVEVMDSYAFYECGALKSFNVEDGSKLKSIGDYAFMHDIGIESVYIPDSVTKLGVAILAKANEDVVLQVVEHSAAHAYAIENNLSVELRSGVVNPLYSGNCTDSVTWALYPDGTLAINGSGAMKNYTSHTEQPWASYRHKIKKVVIGKDVTTVGNYAFAYSQNIESIEFEQGSKLTSVGVLSFMNVPKVKEVNLPDTVTYLGAYSFGDCFALESVYIPQNIDNIYHSAFQNSNKVTLNVAEGTYAENFAKEHNIKYTTREFEYIPIAEGSCGENATWQMFENGQLRINGSGAMENYTSHTQQPWAAYRHKIKKVVIGKDITTVGNYAFAYSQNIESIEFKEGSKLTSVGILSFMNVPKVKEVKLPETVTSLGAYSFGDCFALESLYIPQRMGSIYRTAFTNSDKLTLSVVEGTYAENFAKEHNIKYTTREFEYIPTAEGTCGKDATWQIFENGELRINGSGAMKNYSSHTQQPWASYRHKIKKVVIGKDITAVGNYAFAYSQNIESIEFEEGSKLTSVGILSFMNVPKVKEVKLPETVTSLGAYAFGDCFALESLYIPQGVNNIYYSAFTNSNKLTLSVTEGSYAEKFAKEHNIKYVVR